MYPHGPVLQLPASAICFRPLGSAWQGRIGARLKLRGSLQRAICLGLWASAPVFAAPAASTSRPEPTIAVQPAVVAFASAHKIPIAEIEPASSSEEARMGDSFTAVVTLREGKSSKQWLTQFRIVERTADERAKVITETIAMTVNAREFVFTATRDMAIEIKTAGPFTEGKKASGKEKGARALISPTFLRLGFDKVSRTFAAATANPPASDGVAPGAEQKSAELSEEQLRAFAGLFPTLTAFYGSIENTPGLREILWDILDKPSVWSLAKNRGVKPGFNLNGAMGTPVDITGWDLAPETPLYELGFQLNLNDQPALICTLFVTSPRPPLLASAGVVGILAESPNRTKRLDIRVVAAHRGPEEKPATVTEKAAKK
jgi:hypothetical protein